MEPTIRPHRPTTAPHDAAFEGAGALDLTDGSDAAASARSRDRGRRTPANGSAAADLASPYLSELVAGQTPGDLRTEELRPAAATVSVLLPVKNEADNLRHVLPRIPSWVDEIIIVDGHSTDGTRELATAICPQAIVIDQEGNGKGDAIACGLRHVSGEITVLLDGDGSTDPQEIPRFVVALANGFDVAKGTRFVTGGGSDDITWLRRLGNRLLTGLVNRVFGVRYSDLCYGYNAFWTRCVPAAVTDCPGFEIETLMNIRLAVSKKRVVEVPSFESHRRAGRSNLHTGRDGWRVLRTIAAEWIRPR